MGAVARLVFLRLCWRVKSCRPASRRPFANVLQLQLSGPNAPQVALLAHHANSPPGMPPFWPWGLQFECFDATVASWPTLTRLHRMASPTERLSHPTATRMTALTEPWTPG